MAFSPLKRYQQKLELPGFVADNSQLEAVEQLDKLYHQLLAPAPGGGRNTANIPGLYLWGDVGRGKTFLMDLFYQSLPENRKLRLHFHRFMARMHQELRRESGHEDPLTLIAKRLAKECRVLCFDEFFVSDIGDAMILGRLFHALFEQGITLVATSNIPVEDLYKGGLQRQRFEPTIQLLLQYTQQIHLGGKQDHRLRHLQFQQTFFLPQETEFSEMFQRLNTAQRYHSEPLTICHRRIPVIRASETLAWFDFASLCHGPRSQLDYIELASRFDTVLLTGIPVLGGECRGWIKARGTEDGSFGVTETGERVISYASSDDPARRFISLVDELYERRVNLYLSAEVPLDSLYTGGALTFEFRRTKSRLAEMQSREYLQQVHLN